jgi:hypothetical protein
VLRALAAAGEAEHVPVLDRPEGVEPHPDLDDRLAAGAAGREEESERERAHGSSHQPPNRRRMMP